MIQLPHMISTEITAKELLILLKYYKKFAVFFQLNSKANGHADQMLTVSKKHVEQLLTQGLNSTDMKVTCLADNMTKLLAIGY